MIFKYLLATFENIFVNKSQTLINDFDVKHKFFSMQNKSTMVPESSKLFPCLLDFNALYMWIFVSFWFTLTFKYHV